MEVPKDFSALLESFNANRVEYPIVGGYALAHDGAPRFTGDLDLFVPLGLPPVRIGLLRGIGGVTWEEATRGAEDGRIEEQAVPVIGRAAFIANKRASGRSSDLADLEALGES